MHATPLPSVPAMDLLFAASPVPQSLSRRLDGALLAVNDAWVRLTGIARAQALGRTSLQLAQWPSAMERQDYLESIERGEPSYTVESYGERGLRVRLSTTRLMHEGQELLLVGWEDITREHEAESRSWRPTGVFSSRWSCMRPPRSWRGWATGPTRKTPSR